MLWMQKPSLFRSRGLPICRTTRSWRLSSQIAEKGASAKEEVELMNFNGLLTSGSSLGLWSLQRTNQHPQLPFKERQIPSNRDHKALNRERYIGGSRKKQGLRAQCCHRGTKSQPRQGELTQANRDYWEPLEAVLGAIRPMGASRPS